MSTAKITITKERITPEIAERMLATNIDRNRNISMMRVHMYSHDMLSDKWMDNAEPIKFDSEGHLIDGQHRLKAIVHSGKTMWLWVAKGMDASAFDTIDVGFARTPRQIFNMSDDPLKHCRTLPALCGFTFRVLAGVSKATQSQLNEFVEANRTEIEWLYSTVNSAAIASAYYLLAAIAMHLYGVQESEINGFLDGAIRSKFDPKKDPTAFKFCVQAENLRRSGKARSFTLANFQNMGRCAYSYVNSIARLTQKEDCYPIKMTDQYKIVKRDEE